jgi:hypothetical protein
MFQPSLENTPIEYPPGASEIVISILDEVGDLAKLMELFYLSREPGLLEILRWLASLPNDVRQQIAEFALVGRANYTLHVERAQPSMLVLTRGPD